jgi:NADP-dependent 3-hydroxy acid dehydrogenase YdfG
MITAQLEYLKCSLCLCRVTSASNSSIVEPAATACQVLSQELRAESHELEVCYHHAAGAPLRRLVRRYGPVPQTLSQSRESISTAVKAGETTTAVIADDVYIITGGLGGLGLLTARCLAEHGARKLVLVTRSGKVPYEGQGLEDQLRTLIETPGVAVQLLQCDVSDEDQVERMLSQARELGPLGGIIQAAGVLSDGLIVTGKAAQGASVVWDAKAKSANLLHKHTSEDLRVRLFLTYSSVTAAVGTAGQAAYAGANRYLEWLVQERIRRGLAGLCIRWPEVTGVGMAAALHGSAHGSSGERTCAISAVQAGAYLRELLGRPVMDHASSPVLTLAPPALLELYSPAVIGKQFAGLQLSSASPSRPTAAHRCDAIPIYRVDRAVTPSAPLLTEAQVRGSVHRLPHGRHRHLRRCTPSGSFSHSRPLRLLCAFCSDCLSCAFAVGCLLHALHEPHCHDLYC